MQLKEVLSLPPSQSNITADFRDVPALRDVVRARFGVEYESDSPYQRSTLVKSRPYLWYRQSAEGSTSFLLRIQPRDYGGLGSCFPGVLPLPLFIDWRGVLSSDGLWYSITEIPRHSYHKEFLRLEMFLFSQESFVDVENWKREGVSTKSLLRDIEDRAKLDVRAKSDFAVRWFAHDCRWLRLNDDLVSALHLLIAVPSIVIATDNMDLSTDVIASRSDVREFADHILSSSDLDVLKYESPHDFFGS